MGRNLTQRKIVEVCIVQSLFNYQYDTRNMKGFSREQKVTSALRILCYGAPTDSIDDYIYMEKTTAYKYLQFFCKTIVQHFGPTYLRKPNKRDIEEILRQNVIRGFPGMLGSLDCMHWVWKGCLVDWAGQYMGHYPKPTVILEASVTYDCWIWHAFFGLPGSHNDISVLHKSPLFEDLKRGRVTAYNFTINDNDYTQGYYLADRIYLQWSTLVQAYSQLHAGSRGYRDKRHFNTHQMAKRKDVECAFRILKINFAIICGPYRSFDVEGINSVTLTCIILHNMVIAETHRDPNYINYEGKDLRPPTQIHHGLSVREYRLATDRIQNADLQQQLRHDLTIHLWARGGDMGLEEVVEEED